MKVVILAGGFGTRISEESHLRPKPMIEICGKPILWHIMKIYSTYDINEFIICLGYKGYIIKEYFANYFLHMSDVTFDMEKNAMEVHQKCSDPWRVTLVDTGDNTMTGGRLKRVKKYIGNETFCFTYGDGLSDINIKKLINFHKDSSKAATVSGVQLHARFGAMKLKGDKVIHFKEKPENGSGWINGGFFVMEPEVFDLIEGDETVWEREPMQQLAQKGELSVFKHTGFWHPMDTLRDRNYLEAEWESGKAPWKLW
jgi:glucose-1-phosphate cytidylyltransferase